MATAMRLSSTAWLKPRSCWPAVTAAAPAPTTKPAPVHAGKPAASAITVTRAASGRREQAEWRMETSS